MEFIQEIVALGIDSIIFGLALKFYLKNTRAANAVKGLEVHDADKLKAILETTNDDKPVYAAVRGVVKALGTPIASISDVNFTGVVQRLRLKEHIVAKTAGGFWTKRSRIVEDIYNHVPFILCSGNQIVKVLEPLRADVLDLDTVTKYYTPTNRRIPEYLWGFFIGMRQKGLTRMEDILKEGSVLTGIGEVSFSKNENQLILTCPHGDLPYYLTSQPISSISYQLQCEVNRYKFLLIVSATCGIAIFSIAAYRWWKMSSQKETRRH